MIYLINFGKRLLTKMKLKKELIKNRQSPDENLKNQIETVLQECRQNSEIPNIEEVERRNKSGTLHYRL